MERSTTVYTFLGTCLPYWASLHKGYMSLYGKGGLSIWSWLWYKHMGVETVYRSPAPMWSEKAQPGATGKHPKEERQRQLRPELSPSLVPPGFSKVHVFPSKNRKRWEQKKTQKQTFIYLSPSTEQRNIPPLDNLTVLSALTSPVLFLSLHFP